MYKVFMNTPHRMIAERISKTLVLDQDIYPILDRHLSRDWKDIEEYSKEADLILSGADDPKSQLRSFADAFTKHVKQKGLPSM